MALRTVKLHRSRALAGPGLVLTVLARATFALVPVPVQPS